MGSLSTNKRSSDDLVTVALIEEDREEEIVTDDCCVDCFMACCSPPINAEADIPRYLDFLGWVRCLVAFRRIVSWPLRVLGCGGRNLKKNSADKNQGHT